MRTTKVKYLAGFHRELRQDGTVALVKVMPRPLPFVPTTRGNDSPLDGAMQVRQEATLWLQDKYQWAVGVKAGRALSSTEARRAACHGTRAWELASVLEFSAACTRCVGGDVGVVCDMDSTAKLTADECCLLAVCISCKELVGSWALTDYEMDYLADMNGVRKLKRRLEVIADMYIDDQWSGHSLWAPGNDVHFAFISNSPPKDVTPRPTYPEDLPDTASLADSFARSHFFTLEVFFLAAPFRVDFADVSWDAKGHPVHRFTPATCQIKGRLGEGAHFSSLSLLGKEAFHFTDLWMNRHNLERYVKGCGEEPGRWVAFSIFDTFDIVPLVENCVVLRKRGIDFDGAAEMCAYYATE
ncbi:hypothetical protein CYLTODRAFT_459906 [Cylindrobasidium torrendii FP15055 ss-10]|uniref:Uncharacterized protein n=1 Tax=Cylindrobasidium torrendii FP15055 ss-10 TaxID=1314674 RepID=A0A0D7AT43_9AGAR|nr:hypothetical protein CYLTODRAFT_459906 [Cylindrobasidium torrendii FP15055 ss-10]